MTAKITGSWGIKGKHWDTCLYCDRDIMLTREGVLRAHGRPNDRCEGGGRVGQVGNAGERP